MGSVTNMEYIFVAAQFNQPVSGWSTGSVTSMKRMFYGATDTFRQTRRFNQAVTNWNTGSVTGMFYGAAQFNQAVNGWSTGSVTSMERGFFEAAQFNQVV